MDEMRYGGFCNRPYGQQTARSLEMILHLETSFEGDSMKQTGFGFGMGVDGWRRFHLDSIDLVTV